MAEESGMTDDVGDMGYMDLVRFFEEPLEFNKYDEYDVFVPSNRKVISRVSEIARRVKGQADDTEYAVLKIIDRYLVRLIDYHDHESNRLGDAKMKVVNRMKAIEAIRNTEDSVSSLINIAERKRL